MFGAAALFASACTMEIVDPQSQPVGEPSSIVFTAGVETRTTLVPDTDGDETVNHQIHWVSGDKINIDGVEFSTTDDGAKAYFTTESAFVEDNDYVAVYPASAGKSFDEITVPWEQSAVKGNFNSAAVVSVAKTTTTSLDFKNLTSILKFQVPAAASKVTISADQPLAGTVKVDWNNGEPTWVAVDGKTSNEVTVTGSLTAGVDYYVAVLPGEKANFKVSIDGNVSRTASTVNAKRSMVMNMGILPEPIGEGIFINSSGEYEISTESGLFKFADMVKAGNTFKGKTVKLTADIEMTQDWTPIGLGGQNDPTFMGTFDGKGYTISNLTVKAAEYPAFFGRKYCGDVLNVKFDKATVTGNHYGAVIVGWTDDTNYTWDGAEEKFKIHGCEVTNSTVTLSAEYDGTEWNNGDKAGAIVGYAYSITVSNNKVSNTTITGYRDLGGIVGTARGYGEFFTTVSGNEVGENVRIVVDNSHNYKNYTAASSYNLGSVWGRNEATNGAVNDLQENPAGATLVPPVSRNLEFAEATATAVVGETFTAPRLTGTTDGVTYTSSNPSVATVDASGNVTLVAAGETTITASAPDAQALFAGSASYTLTVTYPISDYALIGSHNNWSFSNLTPLYKDGDYFVVYDMSGLDEFKIVNKTATGWTDGSLTKNVGCGEQVKASGTTHITLHDNGSNIKVASTSVKYNLKIKNDFSEITIVESEMSGSASIYSIVGSNANWDSDIVLMTTSTSNILVAKNVYFKKDVGVKIRQDRDWKYSWSCDWKGLKVNKLMTCQKGYDCNMLFADNSSDWDKYYDVYVQLSNNAPSKFIIVIAGQSAPSF